MVLKMTTNKEKLRKSDQMDALKLLIMDEPQTACAIHSQAELKTTIKSYDTCRKYLDILVAQGQIMKEKCGKSYIYRAKPKV